jgi:hypothetical protein
MRSSFQSDDNNEMKVADSIPDSGTNFETLDVFGSDQRDAILRGQIEVTTGFVNCEYFGVHEIRRIWGGRLHS